MDPYVEGKRAYQAGAPKKANPYADGTTERVLWGAGWRDGQKTDEEYGEASREHRQAA